MQCRIGSKYAEPEMRPDHSAQRAPPHGCYAKLARNRPTSQFPAGPKHLLETATSSSFVGAPGPAAAGCWKGGKTRLRMKELTVTADAPQSISVRKSNLQSHPRRRFP